MVRELKLYPENEDILRTDCDPVEDLENHQSLIDEMVALVDELDALGIAAPQIGVDKEITVINPSQNDPLPLVNPEITHHQGEIESEEGCLSFPGLTVTLERSAAIQYKYTDRDGEEHEDEAHGFSSTVIQHEVDHLNGTLFIDRLSDLRKRMAMKDYKKIRKKLERSS